MAKNQAETVHSIVNALNEVKLATNYPDGVKTSLGTIFNKHKVNPIAVPVLKEMEILGYTKEKGNTTIFKWNAGVLPIDIKLAEKVYDRIKKKQNISQAQSRFKRGIITEKQFTDLVHTNGGTEEDFTSVKATPVAAPVEKKVEPAKPATKKAIQTAKKLVPLLTEVKKVGKDGTVETTKILNPEVVRKSAPKFDKELGTVFGYKHIQQQPFYICKQPLTVVVDQVARYDAINIITYELEGSHLVARFHKDLDLKSLFDEDMRTLTRVGQINISNTLLGFCLADQGEILNLRTVKVQDPYNIL